MADWQYYKSGQQFGPVDEDALRGLMASGQLSPDDLVWNEELSDWVAIHSVPELAQCFEAQLEETEQASFACVRPVMNAFVDYDNTVVCTHTCRLPPVCFKCGQPATKYLPHNLHWYDRLVIGGISLLLALFNRRTAQIAIPLCDPHLRYYLRIRQFARIVGIVGAMGMLGAAVAMGFVRRRDEGVCVAIMGMGIVVMLVAVGIHAIGGRAARAKFIDTRSVHLLGAGGAFLRHIS